MNRVSLPYIPNPTVGTCHAKEADCPCNQGADHTGPHTCDCGGSWHYNESGQMIPVTFPGGRSLGGTLAAFLGFTDDEDDGR